MSRDIGTRAIRKQSLHYDSYQASKSYVASVWENVSTYIRGRILDIGGNNGSLLDCGKKMEEGWIVDITPEMLKTARDKGYKAMYSDMHHLPFARKSFDTVLLINTLEHSPLPLKLLQEVKRILIPGGQVIIDVPNPRSIRQIINLLARGDPLPSGNSPLFLESPNHYFQYSSRILSDLLLSQDFTGVKVFGKGPVMAPFRQIYRLLPNGIGRIIATDIIGVASKL